MKFKDLQIGERYRETRWSNAAVAEKIEPEIHTSRDGNSAIMVNYLDVASGVIKGYSSLNAEVVKL